MFCRRRFVHKHQTFHPLKLNICIDYFLIKSPIILPRHIVLHSWLPRWEYVGHRSRMWGAPHCRPGYLRLSTTSPPRPRSPGTSPCPPPPRRRSGRPPGCPWSRRTLSESPQRRSPRINQWLTSTSEINVKHTSRRVGDDEPPKAVVPQPYTQALFP